MRAGSARPTRAAGRPVRAVVAPGHRGLDRHPELRWIALSSQSRACRRVSSRPSTGPMRTSAATGWTSITTVRAASAAREGAAAGGAGSAAAPHERHRGQHRQRRVGGQQPAPEVARLEARYRNSATGTTASISPRTRSRRSSITAPASAASAAAQPRPQRGSPGSSPRRRGPGPASTGRPPPRPGRAGRSTGRRRSST